MTTPASDIDELYWHALGLQSAVERENYLQEACGDVTREKVLRLIRAQGQAEQFWKKADASAEIAVPETSSIAERPGHQIGAYLLQEQIGEGGMGVVFVALQTTPIKRRVAIKIVKPGMDSRQVVARFEAERQALALMEHPHIARVFDAGTTAGGRPYFVMELVRGIPITKFCRRHQFDMRQRLQLFVQVCHAVQHAHQKGIIHRDLKPSNVLVELHDVTAVPKIIDFGIAKAMSGANPGHTVYTGFHEVMGTPMYMSPEQAEFNALDIDTRSDVYALGVLLYELLTENAPFDRDRLREASFPELFRIIREETPPRPSTRRSRHRRTSKSDSSTRIDSLHRRFHSELDWVVMKALEKDRTRRYQSATELAEDVQRFLNHQEVRARPPSLLYRFSKLIRRNKALVTGVLCVFLTLIAGLLTTIWQAEEAETARRRADAKSSAFEAARDEAVRLKRIAEEAKAEAVHQLYLADMRLASAAFKAGDIPRVRSLLEAHRDTKAGVQKIAWRMLDELTDARPIWSTDFLAAVQGTGVSPDGRRLAVATRDSRIHILDVTNGRTVFSFLTTSECNNVTWHPSGNRIATAGASGAISYWNLAGLENRGGSSIVSTVLQKAGLPTVIVPERTFPLHSGEANDCLFSPDGKQLFSCGDDGVIRVCDAETGSVRHTFTEHEREVEQLALSADGTFLASASSDGTVQVHDLKSGNRIRRWQCSPEAARVVAVTFSQTGSYMAAGDIHGNILVTDLPSGETVRMSQADGIESLAFDRSAPSVISGDRGGAMRLWNIVRSDDGGLHWRIGSRHWQAHPSYVQSMIRFGGEGRLLSGGRDGGLSAWPNTSSSGDWWHTDSTHGHWLTDGRILSYGNELYEVDSARQKLILARLPQPERFNRYYANDSPTNVILATPGQSVSIHDWSSGDEVAAWDFPYVLHRSALSADGRWLAAADFDEREFVHLFRVGESQVMDRLPARQCSSLLFSRDATVLAASEQDDVLLYDLRTGKLIRRMQGHESTIEDFAFNPNTTRLASVSDDRRLIVWDIGSGRIVRKTRAHLDEITWVDWSPDGSTIATTSDDNTLKLWDAESLQPFLEYQLPSQGRQAIFNSTGQQLLVRTHHHGITVLGVPPTLPVDKSTLTTAPGGSRNRSDRDRSKFTVIEDLSLEQNPEETVVSGDGSSIWGVEKSYAGGSLFRWGPENGVQRFLSSEALVVRTPVAGGGGETVVANRSTGRELWKPCVLEKNALREAPGFVDWTTAVVRDISTHGEILWVGQGSTGLDGERRRGWRRQQQEVHVLPPLDGHDHCSARCVTADGLTVFGISWQGDSVSRSADASELSVVQWTGAGARRVPELYGNGYNWRVTGCSANGSVIVGERWPEGTSPVTDTEDPRLGFRWEHGEVTLLGRIQTDRIHAAVHAVSADGRIVVGHSGTTRGAEAVVWDAVHGLRSLQQVATENGVRMGPWSLQMATDVSDDGSVIVGFAQAESGRIHPFVLHLPALAGPGPDQP